jgi:citrate lyase subunit beta / citryl-CoA lyase
MQEPPRHAAAQSVKAAPVIRSLLYVPASSERFVAKAAERGADAIILDLEDAVAPSEKAAARNKLAETVPMVGKNGATVFVRINAEPERQRADAEAAVKAGAFGILVTKARDPDALREIGRWLEPLEKDREPTVLVPMIEDPGAVLDARALATASPRIFALLTGGEDLATALGGEPTPEVLTVPKLLVHYAAKAAGVLSWGLLRTVADYSDLTAIERSVKEARAHGIDGATCVHPAVIPLLNKGFSPSPEEIDHARRLVETYDKAQASGVGAVEFEGRMIDEPVAQRARALLRRA